jgi:hypothetical protein
MGGKIGGINLKSHFDNLFKSLNLDPKNSLKSSKAILKHQTTLFYGSNLIVKKYFIFYTLIL